ncbi:MAG: hypothetical protein IJV22_09115 [Bacteroidales bacterium]|nr:hypothetical protein [Bacteroidales bacterium]
MENQMRKNCGRRRVVVAFMMMWMTLSGLYAQEQRLGAPVSGHYNATLTATGSDVVLLNDLDDHTWVYYSDVNSPIRSLGPADVKITYLGNGNTVSTAAGVAPALTSFTASTDNKVKVNVGEAEHTYIYYKTLERTDGSTAASASAAVGDLPYTTIPNPFQVRPSHNYAATTMPSTTRAIYISTGRSAATWGGTGGQGSISVTYTDASGNTATWNGGNIQNGSTPYTTIVVKTGTTITMRLTRSSGTVTCRAQYDDGSGSNLIAQQSKNTNGTSTYTSGAVAAKTVNVPASSYCGFYAWRIKSLSSGLTIVGKSVGDTVLAESEILFRTSSATGNEVELEALWAQAFVASGSDNLTVYVEGACAYERNFHVVSSAGDASAYQKTYPCTISGYYPDGSSGVVRTLNGAFTANADVKFENVQFNAASNNFNADAHSLVVGRGCTGTVNALQGFIANKSTNLRYHLRVESGTYTYLSFFRDYFLTTGTNNSTTTITATGNDNLVWGTLGSDYDRANNGDNTKLTVTGTCMMGNLITMANQNASKKTFDLTVKSGRFFTSLGTDMGEASAYQCLYMGITSYGTNSKTALRCLTIEGGELASIAGGVDNNQSADNGVLSFLLRMRGGLVKGAIFGGGAVSPASGDRRMILTGGEVKGWIGAGCNGVTSSGATPGGQTNGRSTVYVGGNLKVGGSAIINGTEGGNVFGAGKGSGSDAENERESGKMSYGTTVVVADEVDILHNVFGGGYYGFADAKANVYVNLHDAGVVRGNVYGGANQNKGKSVDVTIRGSGTVKGNVYGGSNTSGEVEGPVRVLVESGTIGSEGDAIYGTTGNVFGCGYGSRTSVNSDVTVIIGARGATHVGTPIIHGSVYCGGDNAPHTVNGDFSITTWNGHIHGSVFGGGRGGSAVVHGDTHVNIKGTTRVDANVYGGGNAGTVDGSTYVKVGEQ